MKIVGLTGGIGSGKTTVAGFFRELGVPVYIADEEAKKLMHSDPEVKRQIEEMFGEQVYKDGILDRKYLASRVFNDKGLLEKLNSIVHPAVGKHFLTWKSLQDSDYVVYEAAILFEKGGYKQCDRNLLITAPLKERLSRVKQRDKTSEEEIKARMNNQWTDMKKAQFADFIIENKDLAETRVNVRKIHDLMRDSA